jgi:hypothetical protein
MTNVAMMLIHVMAPLAVPLRHAGGSETALSPVGVGDVLILENTGDRPGAPAFVAYAPGVRAALVPGGLMLQVRRGDEPTTTVLRLSFEGASVDATIEAQEPLPGVFSFFLGNDPEEWRRGLRRFGRIVSAGLYPGVDLVLRGGEGAIEYDLLLSPGVDPSQIVVRCEGIRSLDIDASGAIVLDTDSGSIRHPIGRCWQTSESGQVTEVDLCYRRIDGERFGFCVRGRDPSLPLAIDPRLVWSTYLGASGGQGGSVGDMARAVAYDAFGNVTVGGTMEGGPIELGGFPATPGTFQAPAPPAYVDAFVTRFRQLDGALVYSSVFGGSGPVPEDRIYSVGVDDLGRATAVGCTSSSDFPTTPGAWDRVKNGTVTSFVLTLSPNGDDLEYATFLEGSLGSEAFGVAVTSSGAALVCGKAFSADFPTTPGAFDTSFNGIEDAFVTKLDPTGSSLEWSTFLGGIGPDYLRALALDSNEDVVTSGLGTSGFPVTPGAYDTTYSQAGDVVVARLDASGSRLIWSTFVGDKDEDFGTAIALVPDGSVVVGGSTKSTSFPTTPGALQPMFNVSTVTGTYDGFVLRLNPSGSSLQASTFLGGTFQDAIGDLAVDSSGVVTVVGGTGSLSFPITPGAFDTTLMKSNAAFVCRLDPALSRLFYSSALGGPLVNHAEATVMDARARVTLVGATSGGFPTTPDAFRLQYTGGQYDAFVTTMDLLLQGVDSRGASRPACLGPIQLNAIAMPLSGASNFGFYCSGAPPRTAGWLVLGSTEVFAIAAVGEGSNIAPPFSVIPVLSDSAGYLEVDLPIAPGTQGMTFTARCYFRNPPTCQGASSWSTSNGLFISIQ